MPRKPKERDYSDEEISIDRPRAGRRDPQGAGTSIIVLGKRPEVIKMIRDVLKRRGKSQRWLADRIGIDPSVLSRLLGEELNGLRESSVQVLVTLMSTPEEKARFRGMFIRPGAVKALTEWRRNQRAWVRYHLKRLISPDLRRRTRRTDKKGWHYGVGDKGAAIEALSTDFASLSRQAEKVLLDALGKLIDVDNPEYRRPLKEARSRR